MLACSQFLFSNEFFGIRKRWLCAVIGMEVGWNYPPVGVFMGTEMKGGFPSWQKGGEGCGGCWGPLARLTGRPRSEQERLGPPAGLQQAMVGPVKQREALEGGGKGTAAAAGGFAARARRLS